MGERLPYGWKVAGSKPVKYTNQLNLEIVPNGPCYTPCRFNGKINCVFLKGNREGKRLITESAGMVYSYLLVAGEYYHLSLFPSFRTCNILESILQSGSVVKFINGGGGLNRTKLFG